MTRQARAVRETAGGTVLLLALLFLAGCGFQLRGASGEFEALPPVLVRGGDPAALELRQMLRMAGTTLVDEPGEAGLILSVDDVQRERRVLSVGTRGRVQEYELLYRLDWHGEDAGGREVIAPRTIAQTQNFSFDESDVIAKGSEEEYLFRQMQRSAVMQLLRSLQFSGLGGLEVPAGEAAESAGGVSSPEVR